MQKFDPLNLKEDVEYFKTVRQNTFVLKLRLKKEQTRWCTLDAYILASSCVKPKKYGIVQTSLLY